MRNSKIRVGPKTAPLMDDVLDYDKVMASLDHFYGLAGGAVHQRAEHHSLHA